MTAKPRQWSTEHASIFKDKSVVQAYEYRPGYPLQLFEILAGLIDENDRPRTVLDAGCGTGFVARELVKYVDRVDAVDFSAAMIETGQTLPGGDEARLHWICGPIEEVPLKPPYALITAAASLHWLDWDIVLPRFHDMLTPNGYLAIVEHLIPEPPWRAELTPILSRYSLNQDFRPYGMSTVIEALEKRGLFQQVGTEETELVPFQQPVDHWVEAFHARNGFSRDRMEPQAVLECDQKLRDVIIKYCLDGIVDQEIGGRVIWGKPGSGN